MLLHQDASFHLSFVPCMWKIALLHLFGLSFFVTALEMEENRFDGYEMKLRHDGLYVFRLVLQLLFVNIPLLVIRLVVWVNYKRDASIFIAKNGIIIVTSVPEIIRVAGEYCC